ncbi:MAG TPA: alanine--tRNA ligase [Longimicrobiaceae bacterium]|jgi:alanyl-tRNA synthetase|nr:alanine--tRNA ligase [Longimicrobiaceae bacterium]
MRADEIRSRFLDYFARNGHEVRPSSSLVPADDPTLLFVNAGMVQFKKVFLGMEEVPFRRATTSQKSVRAGGKHNDLEQVGFTARHHTFFEMLGNFSFGDYFKRDAIRFAWELLTVELGIPAERLWITVHYTDDEAEKLWQEIAGLPLERIFRLGDKDNFWQMADTGPCGPCSEIHFDLRPGDLRGTELAKEDFEVHGEAGEFLELWNLVFMQYDRDADGVLTPLPAPSIDTGAGLERLASVLQGVPTNYHTDLFTPLIERAVEVVGVPYEYGTPQGSSYHVLADHARATAFLLADGVFPSNEGRGYVLRRILRRAVRHAWLLGRREPTLVEVVDATIARMGETYPELAQRRDYILRNTRAEEERFLATIDGGMRRFDEMAPAGGSGTVAGADVFRLYDTFGFPPDLTELMAAERGYGVDMAGFDAELEAQRKRSREDRAASGIGVGADALAMGWEEAPGAAGAEQEFAAYRATELETDVLAFRRLDDGRLAVQLRENPFYAESGGQVSDTGAIHGEGWTMAANEVRRVAGRVAVIGPVEGDFTPGRVRAVVEEPLRRDTERNHTATHLLQAALRGVLGEHVHQQGSLVEPGRLRFDFSHSGPLTADEVGEVESRVNRAIWQNGEVTTAQMGYRDAIGRGAMALFSEKYGDVVRVVEIPGVSMELCGGTHVRTTGQIGLFRIVSESGVAAGVRRIEAVTGPEAFERVRRDERTLREAASLLKTREENLIPRLQTVLEEHRDLHRQLDKARVSGGDDVVAKLLASAVAVDGTRVVASAVEVADADGLRVVGDRLREALGSGIGVLAADVGGRTSLMAVATDDMIQRGVRADRVVREVAALAGGKGGGKPHMAQAGVSLPEQVPAALARVVEIVRPMLAESAA